MRSTEGDGVSWSADVVVIETIFVAEKLVMLAAVSVEEVPCPAASPMLALLVAKLDDSDCRTLRMRTYSRSNRDGGSVEGGLSVGCLGVSRHVGWVRHILQTVPVTEVWRYMHRKAYQP